MNTLYYEQYRAADPPIYQEVAAERGDPRTLDARLDPTPHVEPPVLPPLDSVDAMPRKELLHQLTALRVTHVVIPVVGDGPGIRKPVHQTSTPHLRSALREALSEEKR